MTASPSLATGTALTLRGLVWRPSTRREPTLNGVDLEIPPGQRVLLAGASGSGKSTLLRALAGLLDPESGDLAGDQAVAERPGARGLLLQNPVHALVGATIGRDAAFGPENAGLDRPRIHEAAALALDDARVPLDAEVSPWAASGGEQQRIALAGALALSPGALLLDEPTSMLDAPTAQAVREAVMQAARGRTLVVADHDLRPWLERVDRLIVLGPQAEILADGDPHLLLHAHRGLLEEAGLRLPEEDRSRGSATAGRAGSTSALMAASSRAEVASEERTTAVLRAVDLAVSRRDGTDGAILLEGVDLTLRPGTLTVLAGPSGSGKTSLLRVLLDLDAPAAGSLERPPGEQIAWVPQNPEHSFVARSVREEVTASPWATDEHLGDRLLAAAGLDHLGGANPFTLSGGEQRRLAIVAALAQRPRLLVLDEPTVGLDRLRSVQVRGLLDVARGDGCAVILASHDPEVLDGADAVVRLGAGRALTDSVGSEAAPQAEHVGEPAARPDARTAPDRRIGPVPRTPPVPADALHPLTLSLIGLLGALGSFGVQSWQGGLLALLPVLLLSPLAVRSAGGALLRMAPVLVSAAALAWTTALLGEAPSLSGEAWLLGLKEACRITLFVAPGVLTFSSIDPTALGDALAQRLRMPARPVAASVSALVRAGHLREQWRLITQARALRGLGGPRSPRMLAGATVALLIDGLRSAELQALAMDARGFATAHRRTWALPSPFHRIDLLGLAIALALLVWPLLAQVLVS